MYKDTASVSNKREFLRQPLFVAQGYVLCKSGTDKDCEFAAMLTTYTGSHFVNYLIIW